MTPQDMKQRTKAFALRVIRMVDTLPGTRAANVIAGQLLRAGTSVGANYRAACRAKSIPDFISKLGTVEEECDESIYWIEIAIEAKQVNPRRCTRLLKEAEEILAIVVASMVTARRGRRVVRQKLQSSASNPQSAIRNPQFEVSHG